MKNGFIIINKSGGISSHSVVARTKRALGAEKAGHTGTLDPLAEGVLPVLIGRGVKASEYIISEDKHYKATLLLGTVSDTEDISGSLSETGKEIPDECDVLRAVAEMQGESMQIPPMYSAIKKDGKKLYELAREGKTVEREARKINIYSISAEKLTEREYSLDIKCSKGTYIRTVCSDIGKKLGTGALMKSLTRCEAAGFTLDDAVSLEELEKMPLEERLAMIRPIEELFPGYVNIYLPDFYTRLAKNGLEIYLSKIGCSLPLGEKVKLYGDGKFFALGEVMDFADGAAIKPIKQFEL